MIVSQVTEQGMYPQTSDCVFWGVDINLDRVSYHYLLKEKKRKHIRVNAIGFPFHYIVWDLLHSKLLSVSFF